MNSNRISTFFKTVTGVVTLSLGVLGSAYCAQAATFGFTLGDLPGGGTLAFDDRSLTGANYEKIQGANLLGASFNWNILIGEATFWTGEYDEEANPIVQQVPYYMNSARSYQIYFDTFQEADFIFERGVLTGIQNYRSYGEVLGGRGDDLTSWLNLGVESPSSASLSEQGQLAGIEGAYLEVSIQHSNLPMNFTVIAPWQNPSHNVPEPTSLLASGLALGGLLLKKKLQR